MSNAGDAYVSAWVDPELRRELDELADANDRSRSAEIRLAIVAHVQGAAASLEPSVYSPEGEAA